MAGSLPKDGGAGGGKAADRREGRNGANGSSAAHDAGNVVEYSTLRQMAKPPGVPLPPNTWSRWRVFWMSLLIVLITGAAYIQAAQNHYIWDDDAHILDNPNLADWAGLHRIWFVPKASPQYYPIVHTTFWIEYHLWGLIPYGYHIDNILLHACNAILVFLLLRRLKILGGGAAGEAAAWIAAAFFAVHPVNVESVAWITERKNVLSGFFYLCSLWFAIRVWRLDSRDPPERIAVTAYIFCLLLFVLSLLSKSVTATLPAVILLLVWWRRGRMTWRGILYSLPLFLIGAASGLYTAYLEREHVGAKGGPWDFGFMGRILIAGRALWTYFQHLIWPNPLVFFYVRWKVDVHVWWQYLFPIGALAVMVLLWAYRKRIGRGPLTAILFFAGTLFPALGFFNVFPFRYSFVADHFEYLASLGILVLGACLIVKGAAALKKWLNLDVERARAIVVFVPAVLLVIFSLLSWRESFKYFDQLTLWTDTLEKNPTSACAYNNLGGIRQRVGNVTGAAECYLKALQLDPTFFETWANMGSISLMEKKYPQAEGYYRKALAIEPEFPQGLAGMGLTMIREDRPNDAWPFLVEAVYQSPARADYFSMLGVALMKVDRDRDAKNAFEESLRLAPNVPETHLQFGQFYCSVYQFDKGIKEINEALRLRPGWKDAEESLQMAYKFKKRDEPQAATQKR